MIHIVPSRFPEINRASPQCDPENPETVSGPPPPGFRRGFPQGLIGHLPPDRGVRHHPEHPTQPDMGGA